MGAERHPVQSGHVFALRAGGDDDDLILGKALDGSQIHNGSRLHLQIAQLLGDLQHVLHAPAGDGDLAAVALGGGENGLNAVHVGGKGGDDDPLVAVAELPVKAVGDHVFAGGVALPLHVGGVRQHRQHALISQLAQPRQIHHAVVGSGVDLEVAGEYHRTHGGADGEGYRVGDGVVHVDELHGEASGLYYVTGLVGDELDLVCQPVLFQLQLNKTAGHGGAVDGAVHVPHGVWDGTNVVFVAVGDEHAPQLFLVGHKIGKIGDDQIDAVHVFLREAHAAVDHDHIFSVFQDGTVLADLVKAAQRNNFQFFCQFR